MSKIIKTVNNGKLKNYPFVDDKWYLLRAGDNYMLGTYSSEYGFEDYKGEQIIAKFNSFIDLEELLKDE